MTLLPFSSPSRQVAASTSMLSQPPQERSTAKKISCLRATAIRLPIVSDLVRSFGSFQSATRANPKASNLLLLSLLTAYFSVLHAQMFYGLLVFGSPGPQNWLWKSIRVESHRDALISLLLRNLVVYWYGAFGFFWCGLHLVMFLLAETLVAQFNHGRGAAGAADGFVVWRPGAMGGEQGGLPGENSDHEDGPMLTPIGGGEEMEKKPMLAEHALSQVNSLGGDSPVERGPNDGMNGLVQSNAYTVRRTLSVVPLFVCRSFLWGVKWVLIPVFVLGLCRGSQATWNNTQELNAWVTRTSLNGAGSSSSNSAEVPDNGIGDGGAAADETGESAAASLVELFIATGRGPSAQRSHKSLRAKTKNDSQHLQHEADARQEQDPAPRTAFSVLDLTPRVSGLEKANNLSSERLVKRSDDDLHAGGSGGKPLVIGQHSDVWSRGQETTDAEIGLSATKLARRGAARMAHPGHHRRVLPGHANSAAWGMLSVATVEAAYGYDNTPAALGYYPFGRLHKDSFIWTCVFPLLLHVVLPLLLYVWSCLTYATALSPGTMLRRMQAHWVFGDVENVNVHERSHSLQQLDAEAGDERVILRLQEEIESARRTVGEVDSADSTATPAEEHRAILAEEGVSQQVELQLNARKRAAQLQQSGAAPSNGGAGYPQLAASSTTRAPIIAYGDNLLPLNTPRGIFPPGNRAGSFASLADRVLISRVYAPAGRRVRNFLGDTRAKNTLRRISKASVALRTPTSENIALCKQMLHPAFPTANPSRLSRCGCCLLVIYCWITIFLWLFCRISLFPHSPDAPVIDPLHNALVLSGQRDTANREADYSASEMREGSAAQEQALKVGYSTAHAHRFVQHTFGFLPPGIRYKCGTALAEVAAVRLRDDGEALEQDVSEDLPQDFHAALAPGNLLRCEFTFASSARDVEQSQPKRADGTNFASDILDSGHRYDDVVFIFAHGNGATGATSFHIAINVFWHVFRAAGGRGDEDQQAPTKSGRPVRMTGYFPTFPGYPSSLSGIEHIQQERRPAEWLATVIRHAHSAHPNPTKFILHGISLGTVVISHALALLRREAQMQTSGLGWMLGMLPSSAENLFSAGPLAWAGASVAAAATSSTTSTSATSVRRPIAAVTHLVLEAPLTTVREMALRFTNYYAAPFFWGYFMAEDVAGNLETLLRSQIAAADAAKSRGRGSEVTAAFRGRLRVIEKEHDRVLFPDMAERLAKMADGVLQPAAGAGGAAAESVWILQRNAPHNLMIYDAGMYSPDEYENWKKFMQED